MIKKKGYIWMIAVLILLMLTSCTNKDVLYAEDNIADQPSKENVGDSINNKFSTNNDILNVSNNTIERNNKVNNEKEESECEPNVEVIDLEDYVTLPQIEMNYEKLEDFNTEAIPEIKLGFFIDRDRIMNVNYPQYLIKEVSAGYISISVEKEADESLSYMKNVLDQSIISPLILPDGLELKDELPVVTNTEKVEFLPTIRKLNVSGEVVWEKTIKEKLNIATVDHLTLFDNEEFLFVASSHSQMDKDYLIKCDRDGNVLWIKDLNPFFDRINKVIISQKDEIVLVGLGYPQIIFTDEGEMTKLGHAYPPESSYYCKEWDILTAKLDMDGNMLDYKYLGGLDYEYIDEVQYNENIGIVFIGRTSSTDGDFALRKKMDSPFYLVACIDEDLQLQWVFNEEIPAVMYNRLLLSDNEICIMGDSLISNFTHDNFFIKLNKKGEVLGKHSELGSNMWSDGAQLLPNGHLIAGKKMLVLVGEDTRDADELVIFDDNNEDIVRIKDFNVSPDDIIATDDGGFIFKAIRPVRTVPQPIYVSSIWYEHEVVLMKFNRDYELEWRKSYNKYKDVRIDFVWPMRNGKVLVE